MPEVVKTSRTAFILAYALAYRARWNDSAFNPFHLQPGEAICDYQNWGLSEQEFRSARAKLEEWGFATFRATNRFSVGKLVDTRLFSILLGQVNEQRNGHSTGPATTRMPGKQRIGQRHTKSPKPKSEQQKSPKGSPLRSDFKGRLSPTRLVKPTDKEVWAYADSQDFDGDFVETFLTARKRDGWTIKGKPIRNWRSALTAFCAKLESDRKDTR